ncbi:DUF2169 family type VI secretion system accessory protein [Sorangium sp. So ce1153]|uniref:DUF2169 family type VI secretion system accessory protein n=1 Tax=Sorangium sp. So ce1153 TaxID=3133333 RepID=UPI003F5DA1D2
MATSSPPRASVTPLGAATAAAVSWRFKGELRVTAIVKATFAFANDTVMPRVAPQEIVRGEIHHGAMRSVRLTTDLAPRLLQADVLWTGHAHAPHGRPVETLPVRLGLFSSSGWTLLDKTLMVRKRGGFVRLPVDLEHAYGGFGFPGNPFGVGYAEGEPNILDPRDAKRVAGFGPISQAMPARRRLLGATPRALLEREVAEIPDDLFWEYFQAAPPDQRTPFLRGDEWIVMDGLHPSAPRVRMRLPGARGFARVHGLSDLGVDEREALPLSADILRIDGDEQRCTMTWRGSFPVPAESALARVRILAGVELPGDPIAWPAPGAAIHSAAAAGTGLAPRSGADDGDDAALGETLAMSSEASKRLDGTVELPDKAVALLPAASTLPFQPAPAGASPLAHPAPLPPEVPLRRSATMSLPKDVIDHAARQPATPFAAAPSPAPQAAPSPAPPATPSPAPPAAPSSAPPAAPSSAPPAAPSPAPPAAPSPAPPAAPSPAPPAAPSPAPPAAPRAFTWSTPPPEPPPPAPSAGPPKRPAKLDVNALLYGTGKRRS